MDNELHISLKWPQGQGRVTKAEAEKIATGVAEKLLTFGVKSFDVSNFNFEGKTIAIPLPAHASR